MAKLGNCLTDCLCMYNVATLGPILDATEFVQSTLCQ